MEISLEHKIKAITNGKLTVEINNEIKLDLSAEQGLRTKILNLVPCQNCGWCCKTQKASIKDGEIQKMRKFL